MHYVALLRGINVGGHKKVPMKDLKQLLDSIGLEDIQTYIQSGNLVFQSDLACYELEDLMAHAISNHYNFSVPTHVIPAQDWRAVIANNPFADKRNNEFYSKKLNVTFLKSPFLSEYKTKVYQMKAENEDCKLIKNIFYGWYGNGFGRSKIAEIISKIPDGTTRNWNSILKINEMF